MHSLKSYNEQTKRNPATRLKDRNPSLINQETDVTKHILDNLHHYIDFNNTVFEQLRIIVLNY